MYALDSVPSPSDEGAVRYSRDLWRLDEPVCVLLPAR